MNDIKEWPKMKNKKYQLIALIGKAGSGKDTILKDVIRISDSSINYIISYTTRPMREGEKEGKEYHFISEKDFKQMVNNNQMLEYVQFNNWWYGTGIKCLADDKINIGIFNPSGIRALIKFQEIDLQIYYIHASDKQRLLRQLNREEYPDIKEIIRRYSADEEELKDIKFENMEILFNEIRQDELKCCDKIMDHPWFWN